MCTRATMTSSVLLWLSNDIFKANLLLTACCSKLVTHWWRLDGLLNTILEALITLPSFALTYNVTRCTNLADANMMSGSIPRSFSIFYINCKPFPTLLCSALQMTYLLSFTSLNIKTT